MSSSPILPARRKQFAHSAFARIDDDHALSDPAFFTSDPPDPSQEDYFAPSRKRHRSGTWWQSEDVRTEYDGDVPTGRKAKSAKITELETDTAPVGTHVEDGVPQFTRAIGIRSIAVPRRPLVSEPANVLTARKRIVWFAEGKSPGTSSDPMEALDQEHAGGQDECVSDYAVDISDLGLRYLSDDMLAPLLHVVRLPPSLSQQMSSRQSDFQRNDSGFLEYGSLQIAWKLNASSNAISSLPPRLFDLAGLENLDLSNNNISSVPTQVIKLRSLQMLSLKANRLRYLPAEVLDLIRTSSGSDFHMSVAQNPLFQPFSYVGFQALLERVRKTCNSHDQNDEMSYVPLSTASLRAYMSGLADLQYNADAPPVELALFDEQKRWLLRLYRKFLDSCELIWLASSEVNRHSSLSNEEKEEIIRTWNMGGELGTEKALDHAFLRMKSSLLDDVKRQEFCLAATPITHLDLYGRSATTSLIPPSQLSPDIIVLPAKVLKTHSSFQQPSGSHGVAKEDQQSASAPGRGTRVRSLFALCLETASRAPELPQLLMTLTSDVPDALREGLQDAIAARRDGGRTCSTCKRSYVIPRAEWLEYHVLPRAWGLWNAEAPKTTEELFLPFLRRVCSLGCVPHLEYE